jgi:peptidoglycan hydrolase-like protein with peptidoglycan-binding domain
VCVALVAAGVATVVTITHHTSAGSPASAALAAVGTDRVARTDLTNVDQVSGTLGYAGSYTISAGSPGTLTALPAAGTVLKRGDVVAEIDGVPEYLFYGARPEWRTLQLGVAPGPDVYELDQNLIALGFGGGMSPSNIFGSRDVAAVKRWQTSLGITANGVVQTGAVTYLPGSVRISTHHSEPGASAGPGAPLADATDPSRAVAVALDTAKESEVKVGDTVDVQLPSGAHTQGLVSAIAQTITPATGNGGGSTIAVTVTVPDQGALGTLEGAPVTVSITTASAKGVLAVPITALVVDADGSYAVDVVRAGTTRRVKVTTGLFTDTLVEVTGNLNEGDTVIVAST